VVNEEEEKQQGQKPGGREATTEGRVKVRWKRKENGILIPPFA